MSRSSECTHVLVLSLQYMTVWPCMLLLSGDPVSGWRITTALLAMGWGYCRNVWFSKWRYPVLLSGHVPLRDGQTHHLVLGERGRHSRESQGSSGQPVLSTLGLLSSSGKALF